jgi:hypothetical protein
MRLNSTLYLGGTFELAVPITVYYTYHPASRGSMYGDYPHPPEPEFCEVESVSRTDGLEWHDGCQTAFDVWWEDEGQYEAAEHYHGQVEYAAEMAWALRREFED